MFTRMWVGIGVVVFALGVTSVEAAVIDTLNNGGFVSFSTPNVNTEGGLVGVIGGERKVTTTRPSGSGTLITDINNNIPGSASLGALSNAVGKWNFEYGANTVLGGADLTDTGVSDRFRILFTFADLGATLEISVRDSDGDVGTHAVPISSSINSPTPFDVEFNNFNPAVNFNSIDYIRITVLGSAGGDYDIDFVETVSLIPAPAALPAGLVLLGGMLLMRRRRMIV